MTNMVKDEENAAYEQLWQLTTAVRDACFSAAVTAYEDARMAGLCHEGAWECALESIRAINVDSMVPKTIHPGRGLRPL